MKKLLLFATLMCCSAVVFQRCDALTKATEVTVDMPVNIPVNANYTTLPNTQMNVVDLTTNSTFNDNKSHLKGADLNSVSMILTNYSGSPSATNALFSKIAYTLKFDPSYGDNTVYNIGEFDNMYASDFLNTNKSFNVVNADLNNILDKLPDRPKFTVYSSYSLASGSGNISSMIGTITLKFQLKASVL